MIHIAEALADASQEPPPGALHRASGFPRLAAMAKPKVDDLAADTERLAPHFAASLAYVASQKPKPTRRKG